LNTLDDFGWGFLDTSSFEPIEMEQATLKSTVKLLNEQLGCFARTASDGLSDLREKSGICQRQIGQLMNDQATSIVKMREDERHLIAQLKEDQTKSINQLKEAQTKMIAQLKEGQTRLIHASTAVQTNLIAQLREDQTRSVHDLIARLKEAHTKSISELKDERRRLRLQADLLSMRLSGAQTPGWSVFGWNSTDSARIEPDVWIEGKPQNLIVLPNSLSGQGAIGHLGSKESKFDPQCILRQSSSDLFGFLDPDSTHFYGSGGSGSAWIEIEFRDPIPISVVELRTASHYFPRSFDIILTAPNDEIRKGEIRGALELLGAAKSHRYQFEEIAITSVRIQQKSLNWEGTQYFHLGSVELFSSSGRFSSGVFRTLFDDHRTDIRKFVSVSSRDFDSSDVHLLSPRTTVCTWTGTREWFEIDFRDRQLLLSSYRLKRLSKFCLRSWSLVGSNDRTLPLSEWTVLDSRQESREGEYGLFQGFDCLGGIFRHFRLVNQGPK
jgi:hypothetical protein